MAEELEREVARHYGSTDLAQRILKGLEAAGLGAARLNPADLAPVDEFHTGGRAATEHALAKLGIAPEHSVLDIGCGLGGATRYLASTFGCHVTGIDITPEYVDVAKLLAERTGLADKIDYRVASALSLPYAEGKFDAAITLHVAMNIRDRALLYREVARVLKPGADFLSYDVMKGESEDIKFPVPWADTPSMSHLVTPKEMGRLLEKAGFAVGAVEDRSAYGIEFFRKRLATGAAGGPPPLGLHLLMGAATRPKLENLLAALEAGAVHPVVMVARKKG